MTQITIMSQLRSSLNSKQTRKRVLKSRKLKKIKETYEREVQSHLNAISNEDIQQTDEFFESEDEDSTSDLADALKSWAVTHRIKHVAINSLLKILRTSGMSLLPKDCRTLLKTPQSVDIKPLGNGSIWYYTIRKCLEHTFSSADRDLEITLNFNFDGMPLFNSSQQEFWPMLASIRGNNRIL